LVVQVSEGAESSDARPLSLRFGGLVCDTQDGSLRLRCQFSQPVAVLPRRTAVVVAEVVAAVAAVAVVAAAVVASVVVAR
jgi:hypothetical protein